MLLDDKCKFLLVFPDESEQKNAQAEIDKLVKRAQYISASNVSTAKSRISQDRPHVIVAKSSLDDTEYFQIAEYVFTSKKFKNTAVIFLGAAPQETIFVDELQSGRVQFFEDINDVVSFTHCLNTALNFVSSHDDEPVNLKFLSPGDQLISEGDSAKFVYVVKTGQLEASTTKDEKKVILGSIEPGEFVGEMAYINGESRSANVVALTNCELIEIPIKMIGEVLAKRPSWTTALMRTLSHRMKVANQDRT